MVSRRIDPGIRWVLDVRISAPLTAMVPDDAIKEEITRQLAPEIVELVSRVRDVVAEVMVGLGAKGLVMRGTMTLAGETLRIGDE